MNLRPPTRVRGRSQPVVWAVLALVGGLLAGAASAGAARTADAAQAGRAQSAEPSAAASAWARRVIESRDHAGLPFVVVDKLAAQVVLHAADGSIAGSSAALLGSQPGDHSVPGVGDRTQTDSLRPSDMTTPAGRFVARPGTNRGGDAVLWLDEDLALALHRLRPGRQHAVRARALARPNPAGRRLSAGCVVVPDGFFERVVMPLFARYGGIVYVLPETRDWPLSLTSGALAGG